MTREEAIKAIEEYLDTADEAGHIFPIKFLTALDVAISALKGGWIPIEEREPNNYDETLVCTDTEEIFIATYYAWEGFDDDNGNAYSGEIIAWQPLPEPYKKGE